jgi:hypothetical protein
LGRTDKSCSALDGDGCGDSFATPSGTGLVGE